MNEKQEIVQGKFLKRLNRFLSIVEIDGKKRKAYVPNPGRMHELLYPGKEVYLRRQEERHRKTGYDVIGMEHVGVTVSIDANLPNRFVGKALANRELEWFNGYDLVRPEPRVYNGRFDFSLESNDTRTLIEAKSCTLVEEGRAVFPDAPTERGARHMRHLAKALQDGIADRAAVLFIIQRPDTMVFSPNARTDPIFAEALIEANKRGVEIIPLATMVVGWELNLLRRIDTDLNYFSSSAKSQSNS